MSSNYNSFLLLDVYYRKSLDEEWQTRERRKHGTRCYHFTLSIIDWLVMNDEKWMADHYEPNWWNRTFFYYYVRVRISLSARFVRVVSVFDVVKTDINNSDEENGYCVMMVLANSKNVIKIFFPLLLLFLLLLLLLLWLLRLLILLSFFF